MRAAFFQHQAAQALAVVVEERGRTHGAGDQNRILRQTVARRRVVAAGQLAHQAIGKIVEVVQSLAQERVGLPQHPCAGVGLDALDRGFRGQAGHDRFFELVHPAAVIGEHAIGLEHLAMLAALDDIAVLEHFVEIGLQRFDGGLEMLQFLGHVVGDEIGDHDARLVQHDMTERDAFAQRRALEMHRVAGGRLGAGQRQRGQLARGDHLGEHHGGGLQRLDFLFRIGASGAVLHVEHAERIAGAQNRRRRGRSDRFPRRFPDGTRKPDGLARSTD